MERVGDIDICMFFCPYLNSYYVLNFFFVSHRRSHLIQPFGFQSQRGYGSFSITYLCRAQ